MERAGGLFPPSPRSRPHFLLNTTAPWQFIVYTLAHQYLMKVNDSIVECCRAGAQIQIPHADKFLVEHVLYFLFMFLEILFPAQQCLVVMVSQVLHIQI